MIVAAITEWDLTSWQLFSVETLLKMAACALLQFSIAQFLFVAPFTLEDKPLYVILIVQKLGITAGFGEVFRHK